MITEEWKELYKSLVRSGSIKTQEVGLFGPVAYYTRGSYISLVAKWDVDNGPQKLANISHAEDYFHEVVIEDWPDDDRQGFAIFECNALVDYCPLFREKYEEYVVKQRGERNGQV